MSLPPDDHTLLYLRFYQRFLRGAATRLAMPYNLRIAHEDRRVVVTQQPRASSLRAGENLVHGDGPIIEYRRRRQEMMEAAGS